MTRRRATERQVILVLIDQGAKIPCFRCGTLFTREDAINKNIEREHVDEVALGGPDEPDNWRYSHKVPCHAEVTNGTPATTAGSSKNKMKKKRRREKREAGLLPDYNWPSRKMQNRPFPKRLMGQGR